MREIVSVIVPVYNKEASVGKCIASIRRQTYQDLDIILVDDGSSDLSGHICDNWAGKDNRIRVIHQKNSGVSSARNRGLETAAGTYVTFVDGDDYIHPESIGKMVQKMKEEDAQLVIEGFYIRHSKKQKPLREIEFSNHQDPLTKDEFLKVFIEKNINVYFGSNDNKLYRMDIISENHIRFEEDEEIGEDFVFNVRYLKKTQKISIVKQCLYVYMDSILGSLSKKNHLSEKYWVRFNQIFDICVEWYREMGLDQQYRDDFQNFYCRIIRISCRIVSRDDAMSYYEKISFLKRMRQEMVSNGRIKDKGQGLEKYIKALLEKKMYRTILSLFWIINYRKKVLLLLRQE